MTLAGRSRIARGLAALRGFVSGFTGLPGARLAKGAAGGRGACENGDACGDGRWDAAAVRRALEARSARRGRCC